MKATYTFISKSTAKPGRLDDLVKIANRPSEEMDKVVDGLIARQISVDRKQNTVFVWVTFDKKESLYNYLSTEAGQSAHLEDDDGQAIDMNAIIESFEMWDCDVTAQRLEPK